MQRGRDLPRAPAWLVGLWRRESLELEDGTLNRTTEAYWGQTFNLFVDIRRPAGRRPARRWAPPRGRGFPNLTPAERIGLADQQGFAGHVVVEGSHCSWIRAIDYQPDTGRPDVGRLCLEGDVLIEEGDAASTFAMAYREVFRRVADGSRRRVALRLERCEGTVFGAAAPSDAILVVLDDRFLFARGRRDRLAPAAALRDLVVAAGEDRAAIETCLDCEASMGMLETHLGGWRIERPTMPWRECLRLFAPGEARTDGDPDLLRVEQQSEWSRWRVCDSNLSPAALCALMTA